MLTNLKDQDQLTQAVGGGLHDYKPCNFRQLPDIIVSRVREVNNLMRLLSGVI